MSGQAPSASLVPAGQANISDTIQTPPVPATNINKRPQFTQGQLALALTIQKSRPEGVSTDDYVQQLRKRIKTGRNVPVDQHHYVDSASFWKDQYSKIHVEKKALEDKVHRLEEEKRLLRENLDPKDARDQLEAQPPPLRQLISESYGNSSDGSRKRKMLHGLDTQSEAQWNEAMEKTSPADDALLRMSSFVLRVVKQRKELQKTTQACKDLEHLDDAVETNKQTLLLAEIALIDCCTPLRLIKTNDADKQLTNVLRQLIYQVCLGFQDCFDMLNVICRTIIGRGKKNDIIYRMVTFFSKVLSLLNILSLAQAKKQHNMGGNGLRGEAVRVEEGEYAVNKYLAGAISSIILGLKWEVGKAGHAELLEGLLFAILNHAGRLLSGAVFGEHVAMSKQLGNITERTDPFANVTVKFESRYVVQILHATLGGSNKKDLVSKILVSGNGDPNVHNPHGAPHLIDRAKQMIQNTLIKNSIGGEGYETLKIPVPPLEDGDVPAVVDSLVERYGPQWLAEMLWAMVGWDMVA